MIRHRAHASTSLFCVVSLSCTLLAAGCGGRPAEGLSQSNLSKKFAEVKDAPAETPAVLRISLNGEIARLANLVRSELGDTTLPLYSPAEIDKIALALSSRLFMMTDPALVLPAINKALFQDANLSFDDNRGRVSSLFPNTVLQTHKGSCLGLSLVYLLIAEKLDVPVFGVLVPGHFFVRYDNGSMIKNIEFMKNGESRDNSWYREKFNVKPNAWCMLRNLDKREVVAVLEFNIGTLLFDRKRFTAAAACYERTVQVLPQWGEAWGNLAIAGDGAGSPEKAMAMFEKARQIDPGLRGLSRNLGSLFIRQKQYDRAAAEFERGLEIDPANPDLLYGLAYATYCVQDYERAGDLARKALAVRTNFADAQALLAKAESHRSN